MLDLTKSFGHSYEMRDGKNISFIWQDGKRHDARTGLECDENRVATETPPLEAAIEEEGAEVLTCTVDKCGKQYKVGPTKATEKAAMSRMRAHLKTAHDIDIP